MDYSWMNSDPNSMPIGGGIAPTGGEYGYCAPTRFTRPGITYFRDPSKIKKQWPKKKKVGPPAEVMTCSICKVSCTGEQTWQTHLAGRKHKMNEAKAIKSSNIASNSLSEKAGVTLENSAEGETGNSDPIILSQSQIPGGLISQPPVTMSKKDMVIASKINFVKLGENPSLLGQNSITPITPAPPTDVLKTDLSLSESPVLETESNETLAPTTNLVINYGNGEEKQLGNAISQPEDFNVPIPQPEAGKTALKCQVCGVTVNGLKPWETHIEGAKHKKKVQEAMNPGGKMRSGGNFRGFRGTGGRGGNRGGRGHGSGGRRGRGGGVGGFQLYQPAPYYFNYMA